MQSAHTCLLLQAHSELGGVWAVGQRIWQRDFPGVYTAIGAHQWSETVQPIMEALRDATRRRAFALVSQAYTSIVADDLAAFVGLPVEEAVKGTWALFTLRGQPPRGPAAGTGRAHSRVSRFRLCPGILEQGWQADSSTRMVMPRKPVSPACLATVVTLPSTARPPRSRRGARAWASALSVSAPPTAPPCVLAAGALDVSFSRFIPLSEPAPVPPIPNEQQLARLTDYVAFLEN
ncbi:COP9 signalosome complex subunit 8 [Galemys pyrenaicus]|uniref:COP9 signalosome complex subunit 8 n=1 Tax=Galemys pyrenaicus TaxID=202257 RepID=A0A8J5ZV43_GALPY|nr:COP9 signalosome complex subunit 8 [Galemys pyrenaicus]